MTNINTTTFAGILKIETGALTASLRAAASALPAEALALPEGKWHVTLCHQSFLKPFRKELKRLSKEGLFPPPPEILLGCAPQVREDQDLGRKSWVLWVENQQELRAYLNTILGMVGCPEDPEPDRKFHISLANLTGNPGDSVR